MSFDRRPPIKDGTFIANYLTFMEEQETPFVYDLFCSLFCLSTAMARRVIVNRPRAPVYLNLYVLLAAESGVTRKSTAVRIPRAILHKFTEQCSTHFRFYESKTTPESLEWHMQKDVLLHGYANAIVIISELVTFLGREKYNIAMPGLLTDLFDSPTLKTGSGTISRGPTILKNVYMNFLSASTPSWLLRAINPDVIEGGFTSRCLFVVDEVRKKSVAWPRDKDETQSIIDLSGQLSDLHRRYVVEPIEPVNISLSSAAMSRFTDWYENRTLSRDPFRASFESREDGHVLKIAALLSVNNGTSLISEEELAYAIDLVEWTKIQSSYIFAYNTDDKLVMGIDRIRNFLIAGGMDGKLQSEITKAVQRFIDGAQVRYALEIMLELDFVQCFDEKTPGATNNKSRLRWRATKAITSPGIVSTILDQWERIK